MSFTAVSFIYGLFPMAVLLLFLSRSKQHLRKSLLLLLNILFYLNCGTDYLIFLLLFASLTYFFCLLCQRLHSKTYTIILCSFLALPLLLSKYFLSSFSPVGLSFYTFEAISCVADTYRQTVSSKITLWNTVSYLSFFPTIISGPILRFNTFSEGLANKSFCSDTFTYNLKRLILGLSKKMLIANRLAILADYYFNGIAKGNIFSAAGLWIGSISYSLQLYFDFSGYSDMAVGIAGLIGFKIPENFDRPYLSSSISEFWRRWHISLSTWFRDYIYIPLGGNRNGGKTTLRNLFIVWLLTGIWHGADLSFVVWGLGYFILLTLEKYLLPGIRKSTKWYHHIYVLFFVNLLWIPFRADSIRTAAFYIRNMFSPFCFSFALEQKALNFLPFVLFSAMLCLPWDHYLKKYSNIKFLFVLREILLAAIGILSLCSMANTGFSPYIYGNF